jgi:hypothetical protein
MFRYVEVDKRNFFFKKMSVMVFQRAIDWWNVKWISNEFVKL